MLIFEWFFSNVAFRHDFHIHILVIDYRRQRQLSKKLLSVAKAIKFMQGSGPEGDAVL